MSISDQPIARDRRRAGSRVSTRARATPGGRSAPSRRRTIRELAVEAVRNHRLGGLFSPPMLSVEGGLQGTIQRPATGGAGNDDGPRLVARDKATGEIVGSVDLPGGAIGTPMTYLHNGRQFIALTVGGEVPELVAFALPE